MSGFTAAGVQAYYGAKAGGSSETPVPSLIRFLVIIGVVAGLIYAAMLALVTFVEPQPREMIQVIPPARLNK